jgi:hypothetical protein
MVRPFFLEKTIMTKYQKILTSLIILKVLLLGSASDIHAQTTVSASASFKKEAVENTFDYRVINLRHFLEGFKSPLAEYAEDFVMYADMYGIDYRLVPAITGVESTFGKRIPAKSYNAYGWANGKYKFTSWEDSIGHVSMTLKTKYIDKGAPTVAKIGRRYAPPSKTWAGKVTYFVRKIDSLPVTFDI